MLLMISRGSRWEKCGTYDAKPLKLLRKGWNKDWDHTCGLQYPVSLSWGIRKNSIQKETDAVRWARAGPEWSEGSQNQAQTHRHLLSDIHPSVELWDSIWGDGNGNPKVCVYQGGNSVTSRLLGMSCKRPGTREYETLCQGLRQRQGQVTLCFFTFK